MSNVTAKIESGNLTISIPVNDPPTMSASGKSLVVASTRGNITLADVIVNGKPLTIGVNAYIKR